MELLHLLYGVLKERWKTSFKIPPGGEDRTETWEAREESFAFFLMPIWRNPIAYLCLLPMSYAVTRDVKSSMSLVLAITIYAPYARRDANWYLPVLRYVWTRLKADLRHAGHMLVQRQNWMKVLMLFLHVIRKGLRRMRGSPFEFGSILLYWFLTGSGLWYASIWMLMSERFMTRGNLLRRELWRYIFALSVLWGSSAILVVGFLIMALIPASDYGCWVIATIVRARAANEWVERRLRSLLGLIHLAPVGTVEEAVDEEIASEGYVEPWLEQVRDSALALGKLVLLALAMWYACPILLLWLGSLLLDDQDFGERGPLGLRDGEYVITHRFLTITYARTAGVVVDGVLHSVAHTGLVCLRYRGEYYRPTVLSLSADVVTWGGFPEFHYHESGDKILIASVSSELFDNEVELLPGVQIRVGGSVSYVREDGEECMVGSPVYAFSEEHERHYFIGLMGQLFEGDELSSNAGVMAWEEESSLNTWLAAKRESASMGGLSKSGDTSAVPQASGKDHREASLSNEEGC